MDAYRQFVHQFAEVLGTPLPTPSANSTRPPMATPDAPVALLLSPHPDDEVITGALALRLQRELGARVVNLAITLGSDPARKAARQGELEAACALLGWELEVFGWTGVNPEAPAHDPAAWQGWVSAIIDSLRRWQPRWVFYPHADDWHPTHRGVSMLAEAALNQFPITPLPWRVQTEYWHPLANPNLLVECPPESLSLLVAALCCHAGEIARNPYHLTLPAWMADNVRRGAERVGGPGQPAPKFKFGVLYRIEPSLPEGWPAIMSSNAKP